MRVVLLNAYTMALSDIFSSLASKPTRATNNRVVGIDIGSSSIKVVELQNRDNILTLTTYGELELGPYDTEKPVGQSVVLPAQTERQALVDILRESAVKARQSVFAMPLASSFVTVMSLQTTPDEDISSRVRVEARKYIPIPIAEVTLDWAEVETASVSDAESPTRDVLLAAIQNEALKRFTTLMQTVEFSNPPIEIECFSAIRALYTDDQPDMAIMDVGAVSTKLYIIRGGLLQRMYRVRAGGALYTEKLAADLKCSFEEAEALKRVITYEHQDFAIAQKSHQVMYDRVLKEFHQVIDDYEKRSGSAVPVIQLIGGGSLFPGFDAYISSQLGRPTVLAAPFNKVAYPAFMEDTMNGIGSSFAVAFGAALRFFE
jgi:type IV pilus assembly protein PilM